MYEERGESGVAGATAIETENELIEIGLQVFLAQTVVDAPTVLEDKFSYG